MRNTFGNYSCHRQHCKPSRQGGLFRFKQITEIKKGGAMKVLKIDHLGIAVNSIGEGKSFWTDTLGLKFEGSETVEEQKVRTAFFPVGESEVELLESTAPDGPVAKYIEKKGEGIQHVAFRVENLEAALEELKQKGIRLIDQKPRVGAGGARIAFLHPKATNGVLVELCERE
jgi:methylmalonyl-CoA/ethylmalonyl-CoA epimerase